MVYIACFDQYTSFLTLFTVHVFFYFHSLSPDDVSASIKAPGRGRGRRASLTKPSPSSANSLFETNQDAPQVADGVDIDGLGDQLPLAQEEGVDVGVAKGLNLEKGKLDRPLFPWQSLQAQLGTTAAKTPTQGAAMEGSLKLSSAEEERVRNDLKSSLECIKKLEAQLEAEKSKHSETQVNRISFFLDNFLFLLVKESALLSIIVYF